MRRFAWELWEPASRTASDGTFSCDPEVGGWPASGGCNDSLWIGLWRSRDGVIATPRWKNCGYEVVTIATTRASKIAWLRSCWNLPAIYWSIVRSFHGSGKCLLRMRKCITFVENSVKNEGQIGENGAYPPTKADFFCKLWHHDFDPCWQNSKFATGSYMTSSRLGSK